MNKEILLNEYLEKFNKINIEVKKTIIGQDNLIESLLLAILSNGHIILEGVPGLAKTLSIQTLSKTLDLDFKRISFTPDLLPGDLLGGQIYNQQESKFYVKKGPIFTNFLLADEINRAPSKVQSALLEAMQEKKITIGEETFNLQEPFFVLATQNPIEQEGTYNLPEAQLDRFLLKVIVDYPSEQEEVEIMKNNFNMDIKSVNKVLSRKELIEIQNFVEENIFIDEKIFTYIKDLVFATRFPGRYGLDDLVQYISFGASPRASIGLLKIAKAKAFLSGRDYVVPDDIKHLAYQILRHRIGLTFTALGDDITPDFIISKILGSVIVP